MSQLYLVKDELRFAEYLAAIEQNELDHSIILISIALLTQSLQKGHVCLDLAKHADTTVLVENQPFQLPGFERWQDALQQSALVGQPGDFAPLICFQKKLYFARYWRYQYQLAKELTQRAEQPFDIPHIGQLKQQLEMLFPSTAVQPDWQKVAAAMALTQRFCVITGGPGTGKTTTVLRILALLLMQQDDIRIALAAPTGKAAARMQEAIQQAKNSLSLNTEIVKKIPFQAETLHRLLGYRPDSIYFKHQANRLLPVDVLVVDEASMIDLALMAKLVDALPQQARLILLGDQHQLAAVEAGSVFGDLCVELGYSDQLRETIKVLTGVELSGQPPKSAIGNAIAILRHSYRFSEESGIGRFARSVNQGNSTEALAVLENPQYSKVVWRSANENGRINSDLFSLAELFQPYFELVHKKAPIEEVFAQFDRFKILTGLREGPVGVGRINNYIEGALQLNGQYPVSPWYAGRPIMITQNNYNLNLFNGDIGITYYDATGLKVYFAGEDKQFRVFSPNLIPMHETVYAMTVHKSQGSEFDEVLLLIPDQLSEVMNRALIYTAVTRARQRVRICGDLKILKKAIETAILPTSGF
ncbi:MAG: exodeoxyribonuclease V subunit alpha [Methylococcaceae bacterium]